MQKVSGSKIVAIVACLCMLFSTFCQNAVLVFADVKPTTVEKNFAENPYQNRTSTDVIAGIFDVSNISVNTGKVEYSIAGDKVTIKVSEGVPSRIGPHTKAVTVTEENTYDEFPEMIPYNVDGYTGNLDKTDSGYDSAKGLYWAKYTGSVTKPECKFYSYAVTYTYTLNVAPQLAIASPDNGGYVIDKIGIKGYVKDENVSDSLNIFYAFDTYKNSTAYKSKITADGTEQNIDGTIDITPFKLADGTHKLYMWAVDKRGVKSVSTETSFIVDTVPPAAPTLTQDPTTPTNKSVNVTVSYPSDATVQEVRINGGSWSPFDSVAKDGKILMNDNGTVEARAYDLAGNVSDIGKIAVNNIDKVAPAKPVITQKPDNSILTNTYDTITVKYPSDAAEKLYKLGSEGIWKEYKGEFKLSVNDAVYAVCKDAAGNISEEESIIVTNIDKIPPAKPVITQNPDNSIPTNKDVTITITYPTDAAEKLYKLESDGKWTEYKGEFKLLSNDKVFAVCSDKAGNESEEATKDVTNIDKIPPADPTLAAEPETPTNKSVSVDVYYPADAEVKEIRIDGGDWTDFDSIAKDGKIVMDENGTIEARAEDKAGNVSGIGRLVVSNIDKTSPDTPVLTPDTTEPTNQSVTVSVYYPNNPVVKEIKIGTGDWMPYVDPVKVSENTTAEARSKDEAGNYSPIGKLEITNIDNTLPTAPVITTSADITTKTPITATITPGKDKESGVNRTEYLLEGATTSEWQKYKDGTVITITNIGETKISARTIDNAGNASPIAIKTVTIKEETKKDDGGNNGGGNNGGNNNGGGNNGGNNNGGGTGGNTNPGNNSNGGGKKVNEPDTKVPAVTAVDLSAFISSNKSKYAEGETITFVIEYKNKSAAAATDVVVKAEIPEYTTAVDLAGGIAKGTSVEWNLANVAANTSGKIEYKVSVNKLDKAEVSSSNTTSIQCKNITNTEDDSSKTIFLLYSNVANYHTKYIAGYKDNTFRPANNITRAEVAAIMFKVLGIDKTETANKSYTDLKKTHWAYNSINTVTNAGLFEGYKDGSFHPDSYITRAEFATVLANYLKLKNVEHNKINFSDIGNHWAKNFIEEIYRVKLIEGYIEKGDRLFKPNNNISRSEAVTIVNNMLFRGPLSGIKMPFKDVAESHWAHGQILESALDHHYTRNENDEEIAVPEK